MDTRTSRLPALPRHGFISTVLLGWMLAGAHLILPEVSQAQDIRQLTQQVRQLEEQSAREVQLTRQVQTEAAARISTLEVEKGTLMAQLETLHTRLNQLEQESRTRDRVTQPAAQPTTRGFEPSGSGWRFAVGSSYLEISENGVQLRSAGDLLVEGASRLELKGGQDATLQAALDVRLTSGTAITAQSGTNVSVNAGGTVNLQNAGGGRLGFQGNVVSLFGGLVQLGAATELRPVAHVESVVVSSPGGGGGSVLTGSGRVLVGN